MASFGAVSSTLVAAWIQHSSKATDKSDKNRLQAVPKAIALPSFDLSTSKIETNQVERWKTLESLHQNVKGNNHLRPKKCALEDLLAEVVPQK